MKRGVMSESEISKRCGGGCRRGWKEREKEKRAKKREI